MKYAPYTYDQLNLSAGLYSPSTQKYDAYSFAYWERALFQRACYSIQFELGDTIEGRAKDFFIYCLFRFGFVAFWDDKEYGKIFNPCTLKGYNLYYQPTSVLVTNPAFNQTKDMTIGKDCELIKLTPDYLGIWDIIEFYARELSSLDPAVDMSIINSKVPFVMRGRNKTAAETIKKMFDKINRGEPAVFLDEKVLSDNNDGNSPLELIDRSGAKESYILDLQLRDRQTLLNQFDCEIGIPTIPYEKKERMVTSEADSKVIDSQARITIWLDTLKDSFKLVNDRYGTNFEVVSRYELLQKEGVDDGETDVNRSTELS